MELANKEEDFRVISETDKLILGTIWEWNYLIDKENDKEYLLLPVVGLVTNPHKSASTSGKAISGMLGEMCFCKLVALLNPFFTPF